MQLPVPPLDGSQLVFDVEQEALPRRGCAQRVTEEGRLVDAVNGPILGHEILRPRDGDDRGEQVRHVNDRVARHPCRHTIPPPDDAGHPQAALHGGMIRAHPRTGRAPVGRAELGSIVRGEDEDGVVPDLGPKGVEVVEDLAHAVVHLRHRVGKLSLARLASKVQVRQRGEVQVHQRVVEEEGLVGLCFPREPVPGPLHEHLVDQPPLLQVVHAHVLRRPARHPAHDVRQLRDLGLVPDGARELALVRRPRDAEPLVEPPVARVAPLDVPEVPLAVVGRGVPGGAEHLGQRRLPRREALREPGRHALAAAGADGVAARHEGAARGHAVALDVEVVQEEPLRRERVDPGRGGSAEGAAAVAAQLAPAQVVGEDEDDIWLGRIGGHWVVVSERGRGSRE